MRSLAQLAQNARQHVPFLWMCLGQVVLLNLFYIGPAFNDDYQYIEYAAYLLRTGSPANAPMAVRNLLVLPLTGAFAVFGSGDIAIRVTTTLFNVAALCAVYLLGLRCFNRVAALVGCLLWICFPLIFQYSTQVGADIPAVACLGFALWLLLKGGLFAPAATRRSLGLYFSAGLLVGVSYLGKTTAVLLLAVPFCEALWFLIVKRRFPLWSAFCLLGAFCVWTVEGLVYWRAMGDFLHHYHVEKIYYGDPIFLTMVRNADLSMYPRLMFGFEHWRGTYPYGIAFYLVIPGLLWCGLKASRRSPALIMWLIGMWLYHQFGTMSLTEYVLVDRQSRYLSILVVPLVLICAGWLANWIKLELGWRKIMGWLVLISALCVGGFQSLHAYIHDRGGLEDVYAIHRIISKLDASTPVYCDPGLISRLQFRDGYKTCRQYKALREGIECENLAGAAVVVNALSFLGEPDWRMHLPDCLDGLSPMAVVKVPWQIGMFREYDPIIYQVPTDVVSTTVVHGDAIRIPASRFLDAVNCYYDETVYGTPECGMMLPGATRGQSVSYAFLIQKDQMYEIRVRYASAEYRPTSISVDDVVIRKEGLCDRSPGWHAGDAIVVKQKRLWLVKGSHRITFSVGPNLFLPHIAEIIVLPVIPKRKAVMQERTIYEQ